MTQVLTFFAAAAAVLLGLLIWAGNTLPPEAPPIESTQKIDLPKVYTESRAQSATTNGWNWNERNEREPLPPVVHLAPKPATPAVAPRTSETPRKLARQRIDPEARRARAEARETAFSPSTFGGGYGPSADVP
ncbi:MAG TPA: hypothetical protein VFB45_13895 [Pseudolabrys sp.]|nr:hypothetical protein [Pseudolabrys sp.]